MITDQQVSLTAKLLDARDAMKRLHGDHWPEQVLQYGSVIRRVMDQSAIPLMEAVHRLAKKAADDEQQMISVMFLAVGAEMASSETNVRSERQMEQPR